MNIVVCFKSVNTTSDIGNNILGAYDLFALKKAIEIKKNHRNVTIWGISMGPKGSEPMLRRSIALGCDEAVLICDRHYAGSDTIATAYVLACAVRLIPDVQLILCGYKSFDGETGFVGAAVAQQLHIPCFAHTKEILYDKKRWKVETYSGVKIVSYLSYGKCVVCFNDLVLDTPIPNLYAMKRANNYKVAVWDNEILKLDQRRCGVEGSHTEVIKISFPSKKKTPVRCLFNIDEIADTMIKEAGV